MKDEDIINNRFGRINVLAKMNKRGDKKHRFFKCVCDCGNFMAVSSDSILAGRTKSCGCLRRDLATKHGHTINGKKTTTYNVWAEMLRRCYGPGATGFNIYGGRGIKVCKRWHKFKNFLTDMGERPKGLTLERMDNEGNYEPKNCKWATMYEQNRNTRQNVWITFGGRTQILKDWAKEIGVNQTTLRRRLKLWDLDAAMTTPPKR